MFKRSEDTISLKDMMINKFNANWKMAYLHLSFILWATGWKIWKSGTVTYCVWITVWTMSYSCQECVTRHVSKKAYRGLQKQWKFLKIFNTTENCAKYSRRNGKCKQEMQKKIQIICSRHFLVWDEVRKLWRSCIKLWEQNCSWIVKEMLR